MNKECSKCNVIKPLSEYAQSNQHKGGLQAWCRECHKAYRIAHADKYRQANSAWYSRNKEARAAYAREWYAKNKDRLKAERDAKNAK